MVGTNRPVPETTTTFIERLRIARSQSGLSQERLAAAIGVTSRTVARWESGTVSPQVDSLLRVADATGVTAAWLIGEEAA